MSTRICFHAAFLLALAASAGCSGSSSGASEPQHATAASSSSAAESKEEQALARLKARQEAACESVSAVLTDCAVADAKATLSPEKLAELDLENTAPQHRAEVREQCIASDMSPRQVKVFEDCLADTSCSVFLECLDQARPQK